MQSPSVIVVPFSDSFSELWGRVAGDLACELKTLAPEEALGPGARATMVVLAAGGAEHSALAWLEAHALPGDVLSVVVGADPGRRIATRIVAAGAQDYFALPEDLEVLRNALRAGVERWRQRQQQGAGVEVRSDEQAFRGIVGESPAIKAALARAARIVPHANATALIVGETGTGKELLAREIHERGPRRRAPFVAVNCSALPSHLVESELFGHERGAFTDAHAAKPGLFEVAEGGTLLLDEIGTLSLDLQAKLLRILDDKQVRRVGGTKWRQANVRVLAATNEELGGRVVEARFRQDLFFRLSAIVLELPPLRERGNDVVLIAEDLVRRLAGHHGLPTPPLTPEARRRLQSHHWPGNVRELKNAIERALLLSPPGELALDELVAATVPPTESGGPLPFPAPLDDIAAAAVKATVDLCAGNRSEAARRLRISRRRLRRLLELSKPAPRHTGTNRPS